MDFMKNTKITDTEEQSLRNREKLKVTKFYHGRCLVNPSHKGIVVHEIVPKSQRPSDWWEFENRVLLCNDCHVRIHNEGAATWKEKLINLREAWMLKYVDDTETKG